MRIIGGQFRSRVLVRPPADSTRPTSDRTRQALFNILMHYPHVSLDGAQVADVFAGSGALGLEALSRGATHVTFFENNTMALKAIQANINSLSVTSQATINRLNACQPPSSAYPMDILFFDPPYNTLDPTALLQTYCAKGWINLKSLVIYEHSSKTPLQLSEHFTIFDVRTYGAAAVYFIKLAQKTSLPL